MSFSHLGLSDKVLSAVDAAGYKAPTPIQEQAIPHVLERRDVLAKNLFDVTLAMVGKGYYAGLELVPDDAPPLDATVDEMEEEEHGKKGSKPGHAH